MIASGTITAVLLGRPEPIGPRGLVSAFRKTPATGPVAVGPLGLEGDTQVNRRFHGGPEKAVYAYPLSGYVGWRTEFPGQADQFVAGAMGENFPVAGLDETSVHIGDVIRCGTALLQVSQLREPCSTLATVHGTSRVVRAMTRSGRCGWYFRVLEAGTVTPADPHDVIERPNPDWPMARFAAFAAGKAGTVEALRELTTLPGLTPAWREEAARRLAAQS